MGAEQSSPASAVRPPASAPRYPPPPLTTPRVPEEGGVDRASMTSLPGNPPATAGRRWWQLAVGYGVELGRYEDAGCVCDAASFAGRVAECLYAQPE